MQRREHNFTTDSSQMIRLRDVQLTLTGGGGAVNVLQGVNLRVSAGESVSVVGPSGAGKTTLLMVVGGLERPSQGMVEVCGHSLAGKSEDDLARFRRRHIGIVFQSFHLVPTMTALENVALPLEFAGADSPLERARDALGSVELTRRALHYPAQLSGGEQQRVALARAFVSRPDLILADEPTGNLDQETGHRVMELLFHLQEEAGTTLLLVTHDQGLAQECGRILHMEDGTFADSPGALGGAG